jgi:hypothetical protein
MDRRGFLQTAIGTAIVWRFGGSVALGQVRWEDEKEPVVLADALGEKLGGMKYVTAREADRVSGDWPAVACDTAGALWVANVFEGEAGEQVHLHALAADGSVGAAVRLDEAAGIVTHLEMVAHGSGIAACWSEKRGETWVVVARFVKGGVPGPAVVVSGADGIAWKPLIASHAGRLVVAWESKPGFAAKAPFRVYTRELQGEALTPGEVREAPASAGVDANRPAVAISRDGVAWLAWDEVAGPGHRVIQLSRAGNSGFEAPTCLTHHPANHLSPSVAVDAEGHPWVAFTSNRRDNNQWDIPRWIYLHTVRDGVVHRAVEPMQHRNLDKEGTDQSFEFARLYSAPDGSLILTGRPSHNFCLQVYSSTGWSPLYRLPVETWGGRGQFMNVAFDRAGAMWTVRREYGANVVQRIEMAPAASAKLPSEPAGEEGLRGSGLANIHPAPKRWAPLTELEGIAEPLNFYFGDIHGHTRMSDGVGDVDEYFTSRRDYYEDDFASLTDHDTFVRLPIFPSGWELQKVFTEHYDAPGKFVTFFGQEYTTARYPKGLGHKCIWTLDPETPLLDHTDKPVNTSQKLNAAVRKWKGIMAPHHTGWTGTDWELADPEVQMLAEVVSNHGVFEYQGNRPIPHRGGLRGGFLQDALAKGLKFGFIGSSDCHGLIWHHGAGWRRDSHRGGLACVLATDLTREALFEAMRKRRVYATTGIKPRFDFRVNDHLMGEEITIGADTPIRISVDIAGRNDIKWVTIVRNNEDWYQYGGEGFTTRFTVEDESPAAGTSWYYARVEFEGPEMAWSSPVWVTRG